MKFYRKNFLSFKKQKNFFSVSCFFLFNTTESCFFLFFHFSYECIVFVVVVFTAILDFNGFLSCKNKRLKTHALYHTDFFYCYYYCYYSCCCCCQFLMLLAKLLYSALTHTHTHTVRKIFLFIHFIKRKFLFTSGNFFSAALLFFLNC